MLWRDIDIVRAWKIVVISGAEKTIAIGQYFQHTFSKDVPLFFTLGLQDFKDEVLLAETAGAREVKSARDLGKLSNIFFFEFCDCHSSPTGVFACIRKDCCESEARATPSRNLRARQTASPGGIFQESLLCSATLWLCNWFVFQFDYGVRLGRLAH